MHTERWALTRSHKEVGWRCYKTSAIDREALSKLLLALARRLGTVVSGRGNKSVEPIVPRDTHSAEVRSLSAVYGLGELPMHIDMAHHVRPARYLLIGCVCPGQSVAQTRLLETGELAFTSSELSLLSSAPIFVRSGKRSFYSTILDQSRPFWRYDPGCMEPIDSRGEKALAVMNRVVSRAHPTTHTWSAGEVLLEAGLLLSDLRLAK